MTLSTSNCIRGTCNVNAGSFDSTSTRKIWVLFAGKPMWDSCPHRDNLLVVGKNNVGLVPLFCLFTAVELSDMAYFDLDSGSRSFNTILNHVIIMPKQVSTKTFEPGIDTGKLLQHIYRVLRRIAVDQATTHRISLTEFRNWEISEALSVHRI